MEPINNKLSDILLKAQHHGLKKMDKESQLRLLYWVFIFGIEKTHHSLQKTHPIPENQKFIDTLISAHKSNGVKEYLPRNHFLTIF